jgi:hypothetical protein
MHDPMTVAFEIKRPWPKRTSPDKNTAASGWKPQVMVRVSWLHLYVSPFVNWRGQRWYFPGMVTVWHHDPEKDGTDSSCRNRWRKRKPAWFFKHSSPYIFHVHHWSVQIHFFGKLRRRLLTRCETCGKHFPWGYAPVSFSWDSPKRTFWQRWTKGETGLYHHGRCQSLASLNRTKAAAASGFYQDHNRRIFEDQEPYYGCYPWWREAVLLESPTVARERAESHVQRSCHKCSRCTGIGCEACDNTGHQRVEISIHASELEAVKP